jgi:hypothetical protein
MAATAKTPRCPRKQHLQQAINRLPKQLPSISLRHGQVLWLLAELGYRGVVSRETFYEYIKSLRKLGIPFGGEKFRTKRGRRLAYYSYFQIMELAITLSLRVYQVVPDSVLRGIIRYRGRLNIFYQRAYVHRRTGVGRPIVINVSGHRPVELRGLFLDLDIKFLGGGLVRFGPPKLLSAMETLALFGGMSSTGRTPLSLSRLSEEVVALALDAPVIRSGPPRTQDCESSTNAR